VKHVARWIAEQGFTNIVVEIAIEFLRGWFNYNLLHTPQGQVEFRPSRHRSVEPAEDASIRHPGVVLFAGNVRRRRMPMQVFTVRLRASGKSTERT